MTHPYLETERCGDCLRNAHRYEDAGFCDSCNGRGRRYALTMWRINKGESIRIHDLLLQKDDKGLLRGRFDSWMAEQWRTITTNQQLARMLDNARAN